MNNRILIIICCILSVIAVSFSGYIIFKSGNNKKSIVYIDLNKVNAGFALKGELEQKLKSSQMKRKTIIDSLTFDLQLLQRRSLSNPTDAKLRRQLEELDAVFRNRQNVFEQDNQYQTSEYDKEIWTQIDQYVQDYKSANENYKIILGVSGNGNVMAADKELDISEDIIKYINLKYAGHNKNK